MKKAFAAVILTAALAASFAAGCRATMLSAHMVATSDSVRLHPSYIISYRFGPLWLNEIYD